MTLIYDVTSPLSQTALDAFCQKYHIPDTVHLELPGLNQNVRNCPAGKIGVYTSFFWVDASVFPSSIPWYTKKMLARDPSPTAAEFSAKVCDFLTTHPAPFQKFSEPFLCLVGLSQYYDLDDNVYPTFLTDAGEEMDLFAFIRHADHTKMRIGERKIKEGQVPLLDSTKGRVIPLAYEDSHAGSVVRVDHGGQNDNIENLNEGSGDADQENCTEDSDRAGQDEAVTIVMDEEFQAAGADKLKGKKKKRRVVGVSGSDHPPNKLREDHGTSGDAGANTGGKSLTALQDLLECSTLAMEVGVTTAATMPFVTSSVTPTPEREGGGNTDSIYGPNLRTQHPSERFVISSDSSHHSSTNVADAKVNSLVRYFVPPPPVMTVAVTTTNVVGASSAPVLGAGAELVSQVHPSIFADSASIGATWPNVVGHSNPVGTELSADTFYVSQEMNSETLRQIYVPKWNVVNESVLDDPDVCCSVIDQLAPPGLFSHLRSMDYDQLFAEFTVRVARQTCLRAKVRLRSEHNFRERKKIERKCATQVDLLKERDVEIANLKAQLSLKKVKAIEAIHLRNHVSVVEDAEATRVSELNSLKERNSALEEEKNSLEGKVATLDLESSCDELSVKAASLESQRDGFADQVYLLETTCFGLRDQVFSYELFKEQCKAIQDEQVKALSDRVAGLDYELMDLALHLDEDFYPHFLTSIAVIGLAIDKGIQAGLVARIDHGKARRGLADVASYDPSMKASIADIMSLLHLEVPSAETPEVSPLEPSYEQLFFPVHRKEDNVVTKETSLSDSLDVVYARVQKLKEGALSYRLSISDAIGVLVVPLSSENLIGKASTYGVLVTVAATTALAISVTATNISSIPPISVVDYDTPNA
ncbi:hypothetical protein Tco_1447527 [Tanacetum coccineum]